jgi:hypothetical protein
MLGNALLFLAPAKSALLADQLSDPVVICTPDGLHTLPPGENIPEPEPSSWFRCPNCILVKSFVLALATLPAEYLPAPPGVLHIRWTHTPSAASHVMNIGGIGSRAPPVAS